jgi:hypothetical protein
MFKNSILTGFLIAICACVFANPVPVASTQNQPQKPDFCPTPDTLVKKDLFWGTSGGWVSYGESFDTRITSFVGAEWVGINVGKIICIYRGDKRIAFPIALEQKRNKLAPSPTGPHWSAEQNGRKECLSNDVKDCPFMFEKPPVQKDIYEELNFFKGKADDEDD